MKKKLMFYIMATCLLCLNVNNVQAETTPYQKYAPWVYTIQQEVVLVNNGFQPITNIKIEVPLMDQGEVDYQILLREEFVPEPYAVVLREEGIRKGIFQIDSLQPGERKKIQTRYGIRNFSIQYFLDSEISTSQYAEKVAEIPGSYLQAEEKIESEASIIKKYAEDLKNKTENPYHLIQKIFAEINLFMSYQDSQHAGKGALNAITTGEGICSDYTELFMAVARAAGIPSRWNSGYLYLPKENQGENFFSESGYLDLAKMRHSWPEFYFPFAGWVVLDPTFTYYVQVGDKMEKMVDWQKFAQFTPESRHLFFSRGRQDEAQLKISYLGQGLGISFSEYLTFGNQVSPFKDVLNHWAREDIIFLTDYQDNFLGGYEDQTFKPDEPITRAEFLTILRRVAGIYYRNSQENFLDLPENHWAYGDIQTLAVQKIVAGYPGSYIHPERPVTRAEAAVLIDRTYNLNDRGGQYAFQDVNQGYWAGTSLIHISKSGVMSGYIDDTFRPERFLTRAEAAAIFKRIIDKNISKKN